MKFLSKIKDLVVLGGYAEVVVQILGLDWASVWGTKIIEIQGKTNGSGCQWA